MLCKTKDEVFQIIVRAHCKSEKRRTITHGLMERHVRCNLLNITHPNSESDSSLLRTCTDSLMRLKDVAFAASAPETGIIQAREIVGSSEPGYNHCTPGVAGEDLIEENIREQPPV